VDSGLRLLSLMHEAGVGLPIWVGSLHARITSENMRSHEAHRIVFGS
jgi:hypothetical protein